MVKSKQLSSSINKTISSHVESWLKNGSRQKGDSIVVENIKFEVMNINEGQSLSIKPKNLITRFDVYGEIEKTKKKIRNKIKKYKRIIMKEDLSFIITLFANALIVRNKERVNFIASQIFENQPLVSLILVFQKKNISSCWEVDIIKNPNTENRELYHIIK